MDREEEEDQVASAFHNVCHSTKCNTGQTMRCNLWEGKTNIYLLNQHTKQTISFDSEYIKQLFILVYISSVHKINNRCAECDMFMPKNSRQK